MSVPGDRFAENTGSAAHQMWEIVYSMTSLHDNNIIKKLQLAQGRKARLVPPSSNTLALSRRSRDRIEII